MDVSLPTRDARGNDRGWAPSVPAHRTLVPTRSCLKGGSGSSTHHPPATGITIRETPEKRLISPRTEASRELFYTDEEYERFQREAASMAWLLDGATDEEGVNVRRSSSADIWLDDDSINSRVGEAEQKRVMSGRVASDDERRLALEEKRATYEEIQQSVDRAEPCIEKRVPFGVSNRDQNLPSASRSCNPAFSAGEHAHKMTRLEREIENMNMRELKDKIKVRPVIFRLRARVCLAGCCMPALLFNMPVHPVPNAIPPFLCFKHSQEITRRRRERAQATRPYAHSFSYR